MNQNNNNISNGTGPRMPRVKNFEPAESILIVLGLMIIFFNACVFCVMWKKKVLQKSENALLGSLAVSDISVGIIGLPLLFACSYVSPEYCVLCHICFVFFKFTSISTLLHILAIIADRYLRIILPFVHRRLTAKTSRLTYLIFFIWFTSLAAANVPWFWMRIDCTPRPPDKEYKVLAKMYRKNYELTCFVLFFLIPLVLISFFLVNICHTARRYFRESSERGVDHGKRNHAPRAELRVSIVLSSMFILFLVCWFPYFYELLCEPLEIECPRWLEDAALPVLRYLTSTLNPIVYTFYKEDFYQAIKQVLCCCFKNTKNQPARANAPHNRMPLTAFDTRESLLSATKSDQVQTNV